MSFSIRTAFERLFFRKRREEPLSSVTARRHRLPEEAVVSPSTANGRSKEERKLDEALKDTFPASDPVSYGR